MEPLVEAAGQPYQSMDTYDLYISRPLLIGLCKALKVSNLTSLLPTSWKFSESIPFEGTTGKRSTILPFSEAT